MSRTSGSQKTTPLSSEPSASLRTSHGNRQRGADRNSPALASDALGSSLGTSTNSTSSKAGVEIRLLFVKHPVSSSNRSRPRSPPRQGWRSSWARPSEHRTADLEQDPLGPSESKAPLIPHFWNKPRGNSPGGGTQRKTSAPFMMSPGEDEGAG